MPTYNPNTNNLGFGGSPISGITQFGGVSDWTQPATSKAASAISSAQQALAGASPAAAAAPVTPAAAAEVPGGAGAGFSLGPALPGYERGGANAYSIDVTDPAAFDAYMAQQRSAYLAQHPAGSSPSPGSVALNIAASQSQGLPVDYNLLPLLYSSGGNLQDYLTRAYTSWGGNPTPAMSMFG